MRRFRKILLATVFITTVASAIGFCMTFYFLAKKVHYKVAEETILRTLESVIHEVDYFNYSNFSTIHIASSMDIIKDPSVPIKTKAEQLFNVKSADPNLVGFNITDLKGDSYLVEGGIYNFSERDYFKNALRGKESVFGPILNKVTNVPTIFYGAPHYDWEGNLTNTFFLAVHSEYLSKICQDNKLAGSGNVSIVKRATGLLIADVDPDKVLKVNIYDDSVESGSSDFEKITDSIRAGERGVRTYSIQGKTNVLCYAPLKGTDWSVIAQASYSDFSYLTASEKKIIIVIAALAIATSLAIAFAVSSLRVSRS